jgi:hypothetical protein
VVFTEGSDAEGYSVTAGSYQFAHLQHGAVHEPERCVLDE